MSTRKAASTLTDRPRLTAGRASKVSSQRLTLGKPLISWPWRSARRPTDARDIGDGIIACEKLAVLEPRVHDAVDSVHLVAEALDGIWQLLGRIISEVVRLPRLGAEIGHLPEQPLVDFDAAALVPRIEFSGLAAEILQNRAGLEDRDRPAVGAVVIDDRRHAVVGRDGQKLRLELVALGDVDRDHGVREGALLEHDRDLPTIGRRPVIEVDGSLLARMHCRLERR